MVYNMEITDFMYLKEDSIFSSFLSIVEVGNLLKIPTSIYFKDIFDVFLCQSFEYKVT